jgi:hypothetical protein
VGFRYVALVTGNDTDAAWVAANAGGDGNDNQGMLLRVNGAALMVRGANMIPLDELEGRYSAAATARLVRSAAEARMNVLRVWGGGVYQPPAFYDAADELGVLLFHEFWMSGDNNGRWAGEYAWPLDHAGYLAAAAATVRGSRSRRTASAGQPASGRVAAIAAIRSGWFSSAPV